MADTQQTSSEIQINVKGLARVVRYIHVTDAVARAERAEASDHHIHGQDGAGSEASNRGEVRCPRGPPETHLLRCVYYAVVHMLRC